MSYHRLSTAPLASRHRGAGGGAVDNRQPQGSTYLHPKSVQSSGATSSVKIPVASQLPGSLDSFGIGLVAAMLHADRKRHSKQAYRFFTGTFAGPVACGVAIVLLLYWIHNEHLSYWSPSLIYFVWTPAFSLAVAMLILCGAEGNRVIQLLLGNHWVVYIGTISYSLYLWHLPVMEGALSLHRSAVLTTSIFPVYLVGAGVLSVLVAALSYRFVERPFLNQHRERWQ